MKNSSSSKVVCSIYDRIKKTSHKTLKKVANKGALQAGNEDERLHDHELILGLDFGTSSTKVAIADIARNVSYAIDFYDANSVEQYLLSSSVYCTNGVYSLIGGDHHFRDLKLSVLDSPESIDCRNRAIAFLALVIRYARDKFLQDRKSDYRKMDLLWSAKMGIPAAYTEKNDLSDYFQRMLEVAWSLSVGDESVSEASICDAWEKLHGGDSSAGDVLDELEVEVIPEIAAQIYGFVNSTSFDKKGRNIYLLIDVGAGTLDTALFFVTLEKGRANFSFYKSVVAPMGVMKLHEARVIWWLDRLTLMGGFDDIKEQLLETLKINDQQDLATGGYKKYISGIGCPAELGSPDEKFETSVSDQIKNKTIDEAVTRSKTAGPNDVRNVPYMLCGGGSQHFLYQDAAARLKTHSPNKSWLYGHQRSVPAPSNFIMDKKLASHFHRLSVAYGLSMMNIGNNVWAPPLPPKKPKVAEIKTSFQDNYVSKDMV